jgi:apolipoprotein N-acyltransferase
MSGWRARLHEALEGLERPGWSGDLYAAFAAGITVLAFAPFDWKVWALIGPLSLIMLTDQLAPRQAARRGFVFGVALFALGTTWIWNSLYTIGGVPAPIALLLLGAMIAIMGLWYALAAYTATRIAPAGVLRWLLVWPALWVLMEWLRGRVLSGFPWLTLGASQTDSLIGAVVPVAGGLGASLAVLLLAGVAAWGLRWNGLHADRRWVGALLVVAVTFVADRGALRGARWTEPEGAPLAVALVQGNVEQTAKWDPRQVAPTLVMYESLTLAITDADLIVWPEAAIPLLWSDYPEGFVAGLTGPGRPALVMGALLWEPDTGRFYNSVAALTEEPQFYRKQKLVPFGEYFPVPAVVRSWLRLMDLPYSDFDAGGADQPALAIAGVRLGASICYEAAFADAIMAALPDAALLVNVSNDAWFGDSIGPHQHFQMARLRAMEAGRPLLRATNTGITAVVDADGRVLERLPQFERGVLRATVQPRSGATPYAVTGDWPLLIFCLVMLGIGWHLSTRRSGTN